MSSTRLRVVEALSVTTLDVAITQNFDTLPASGSATFTNDSTLPGWYSARTGTGTTVVANDGSSNAGNLYSYGTGTATDRALGSVGSGGATAGSFFWGIVLTNNTGSTITSLDVSYVGEQWRNSAAAAQTIAFSYATGASFTGSLAEFQAAGTNVTALDFTSPITGGTAAALNGNLAANRTAISTTISGLSLAAGQSIFLRWSDPDHTGSDHGLSIDDFSVTPHGTASSPTPTPTPTLSINDVAQVEGNASTTTFTFTVSLSAPALAGGVTFDIATQDNTATTANSDYVARSLTGQTILQGNQTYTFDVTVNGDTTPEPNETFFVNVTNVTGATVTDGQGLGTINNDDVTLTGICQIQGSGSTSPVVGQSITTTGIVTGFKIGSSGGYYIQDGACDGDTNTSNGIFVFTGGSFPAAAVLGNSVQVSGTVQEFIPSADLNQKPLTEIASSTVISLSTGNPLPAPVVISAADTQVNNLENLERLEGMRVQVNSLTVSGPTQGTISEPGATVNSNGVFFGVVTGVSRPFREAGISISDPLPSGAPVTVPRFDENPERIRVDSDAQPTTTALDVAAGTVITNLIGELDYSFRAYTILPEAASPPTVGTQPGSTPVPTPTSNELTVASFNMERFFDTANDPSTSDPVLTAPAYDRRLNKASLIIRTIERLPDVIGVEEMENLTTLQDVAARTNSDALAATGTDPQYVAYLVEGNDVGGIDVGFLVKSSRVAVVDVTQFGKTTTYVEPGGSTALLNDRPPLVLRATINRPTGGTFAFTVIVNHLRSLSGVDDPVDGDRVRNKRRAQAEYLANLIQARQVADPNEKIITVGDMNAFQVNDGYADVIGTIKGTPAPADQVTLASPDLVNPDLTDLVDTLSADQRYSYNFDGNAQVLDHIILNQRALTVLNRFAYARNDSDFPVKNYESTNELRISDHDQPVAYFSLNSAPTANAQSVTTAENTPVGITLTGSDPDSDPLTFTIVSGPAHGTLNPGTSGASQTYTPTAGYSGPDSFTFKVNDGAIDSAPATVSITVNEGGTLQFSSATYSVTESGVNATITITRTGGTAGTATVQFSTSNGTATAGSDYTAVTNQTVTFNDGDTSKTVSVPITNDSLDENDETVNLTLSSPGGSGALGAQATAVLTINDDDPTPSLSINDVSLAEGNSGTTLFRFTVTLSAASGLPVTVNYATANGTANASDYTAVPSTLLTFNAGDTSKTVDVLVNGDTTNEPDETFFVNLSGATNATISDNQGLGTILNDDTTLIQFSAATYVISEGASSTPEGFASLTVQVNRTGDLSGASTVRYATADLSGNNECTVTNGNASQRCDYLMLSGTLRFAAGEASKTFQIPIVNDGYVEGAELFTITLSNVTGGTLGPASLTTVTITDDDTVATDAAHNPYLSNSFFVRMHYVDFLEREPDTVGFNDWVGVLNGCGTQHGFLGAPAGCDRAHISKGFFGSMEFIDRGFLVYRLYDLGLNRLPLYTEYNPDSAQLRGFGLTTAEQTQNLINYLTELGSRTEFVNRYAGVATTGQATQLIQLLEMTAGVTLPATATTLTGQPPQYGRADLINQRATGVFSVVQTVKAFVEQKIVYDKYFPRGFVTMQYFAYLHRDPDTAGWNDWLDVLVNGRASLGVAPGDYNRLIFGFIYSTEYRKRFGQP